MQAPVVDLEEPEGAVNLITALMHGCDMRLWGLLWVPMPLRVGQESGRRGWYVFVDRPKELRERRGGKTVRRKAGETREEALKNALRI